MIARKKMPVEGNEDVRFGAEQRSEIEDSQEHKQVDGTYNNQRLFSKSQIASVAPSKDKSIDSPLKFSTMKIKKLF